MKKMLLLAIPAACCLEAHCDVILTGMMDGTLTGGKPKAIELYIAGTENLGGYEIWRSQNGDPFGAGLGSKAALSGIYTNTFVYLVKSDQVGEFQGVFGTSGFYAHVIPLALVSGNGNEGFQIRDTVGDVVVDQVWMEDPTDSYRDSFWYRQHGTGPDGGWEAVSWWTPGNDALDGLDEAGLQAAVPFGTYGQVWRGFTSAWDDADNWTTSHIPGAGSNVFIPDTAASFPVISNAPSAPAECYNLTVKEGAILTVAPGKALTVHGDLLLEGAPPPAPLVLQSSSGSEPSGSLIVNGGVSGAVQAERHLPKDNSWHFLASPVAAQPVQPGFIPDPIDNSYDLYFWDESAGLDSGWINSRDATGMLNGQFDTAFIPGKGYLAAFSSSNSGDPVRKFTGVPNSGGQALPLGHSDNEWNLLGNPYPCALDWSSQGIDKSQVAGGAMYIWDQSLNSGAGAYRAHNGTTGVPEGTSLFIPAMNGFFVKSLTPGQVTIDPESGSPLAHHVQPFYKDGGEENGDEIRLRLSRGGFSDETLILFVTTASNGYDPMLDAPKLPNGVPEAPEISSVADDSVSLCINTIGELPADIVLAVNYELADTLKLELIRLEGTFSTVGVFLEDLCTGSSHDLGEHSVYSFTYSPGGALQRFVLHLTGFLPAGREPEKDSRTVHVSGHTLHLTGNGSQALPYRVYDTGGRLVMEGTVCQSAELAGLAPGIYIIEIVCGTQLIREKAFIK